MRGPVEVAQLERYSGGRSGTYLSARVITYIFDILIFVLLNQTRVFHVSLSKDRSVSDESELPRML
jgi:hypothetical protein